MGHDIVGEAKKLDETIWKTRGSRLEAYRRLRSMERWSTASVTVASIYVIALSVWQLAFVVQPADGRLLSVVLVVAAVSILALSLYEAGMTIGLQAERFHQSALQLRPLMARARRMAQGPGSLEELVGLEAEYDSVVSQQRENHTPLDYQRFQVRHPRDFKIGRATRIWICWNWWLRSHWRYLAIIVVPPTLLWLLRTWTPISVWGGG